MKGVLLHHNKEADPSFVAKTRFDSLTDRFKKVCLDIHLFNFHKSGLADKEPRSVL